MFSVILPFLVCCFLVRSMCWYQISMYTFFTLLVHIRHVTRDSLQIALWHLLQMVFCVSFSIIWLAILFCPYFVLLKIRNFSVHIILQWIHFCCGLLEVNWIWDATMFIGMISSSKSLSHFLQMYSLDVGTENLIVFLQQQYCHNCTLILWIWYIVIWVYQFYGNKYTNSNLSKWYSGMYNLLGNHIWYCFHYEFSFLVHWVGYCGHHLH